MIVSSKKFSVMALCYKNDDPSHLEQAIHSVFTQSLKPTDVVLVQDGPVSYEMTKVINKLMSIYSILRLIKLKKNMGHGVARATAISACKHNFIAIMDADDISAYDRFELQLNILTSDPNLAVVGSDMAEFIATPSNIVSYKKVPKSEIEIRRLIKWKCPINQPTVMFRKDLIDSVGGYKDWFNNEDYYLWIRLIAAGYKLKNVDKNLVFFRISNDVYSRRGGWPYFLSEYKIQRLLVKVGLGNYFSFVFGVTLRFFVQVLFSNKLRSFFYKNFLRR